MVELFPMARNGELPLPSAPGRSGRLSQYVHHLGTSFDELKVLIAERIESANRDFAQPPSVHP